MNYKRHNILGLIVLALLLLFTFYCRGVNESQFLHAVNQVETSGRSGPIVGDNGAALGPFQIHYSYWKDSQVKGSYSQCENYDYSAEVVRCYLRRYAQRAYIQQDWQTCARIHNGGPRGCAKQSTEKYWQKVRKHLTS